MAGCLATNHTKRVEAEVTDDGFVIGLPNGTTTDWVKNLLADGTATIVNVGGDPRGRPAGGEPPVVETGGGTP